MMFRNGSTGKKWKVENRLPITYRHRDYSNRKRYYTTKGFHIYMKLSQFNFKLTDDKVALYPHTDEHRVTNAEGKKSVFKVKRRDECKLMVLHRKSQKIDMYKTDKDGKPLKDKKKKPVFLDFRNILDYFDEAMPLFSMIRKYSPPVFMARKRRRTLRLKCFSCVSLTQKCASGTCS